MQRSRREGSQVDNEQGRSANDRQLYSGVIVKDQGKVIKRTTEVCSTLMARDYKGFGNQEMTGVLEIIE